MSSFGAIGEWIFLSLVSQALLCLDAIRVEIWFTLLKESSSELSVLLLAVVDTGIDPRRQLLRRFSSIYFDDKVADVRSEALDVLWMESWGTDSCGFTKFRSLSSSRWGGRSCLTGGSCCSWTEASKNKTVGTWMWL